MPRTRALASVDAAQDREGWVRERQRGRERHLLWSPTLLWGYVVHSTLFLLNA